MSIAPTHPAAVARASQCGAAKLRQRILDGLARTGTDPWTAAEIARALGVSTLSVRQACDALADEGAVVVVARRPYAVRRWSAR